MLFNDHFQKQLNNRIKEYKDKNFPDSPGPVYGYGNFDARIMFISDVPKLEETVTGVPFTGIAKNRMVKAIKDIGLNKNDYYLTYLAKHPINQKNKLDVIHSNEYFDFLLEEIELVNPIIICTMGFYVTKALMKRYKIQEGLSSLEELRGNGYIVKRKKKGVKITRPKRYIIPTWNPGVIDPIMNMQFAQDVLTVKHVYNFKAILFD